ncbi:hypothetical protein LDL59_02070 [Kaistella anthropi]|nr:hypothetical protein [Kaistella anthropi]
MGMDLRKPKIFGDFKIDNKFGISNYLTGEVEMDRSSIKLKYRIFMLRLPTHSTQSVGTFDERAKY